MATAAGPRWFGVCDWTDGVRERGKMEERISSYVWKKINLTEPWVLEMVNAEHPVGAAGAWTEGKKHCKKVEKAVWLVCLSQQAAQTEQKNKELEEELKEVRASAGDSASVAERLQNELGDVKQGILQESEATRYEREFLHCQVIEAKERELRYRELHKEGMERYRELEGKFKDIQAVYRVACAEVRDCSHGPCQTRIAELEETLAKVRGRAHLVGPGGSPSGGVLGLDYHLPGRKEKGQSPEAPGVCPGRQERSGASGEGRAQKGSEKQPLASASPVWVVSPGVKGQEDTKGEGSDGEEGEWETPVGQMCPVRQRRYGPPVGLAERGPVEGEIVVPHGLSSLRGMIAHVPKLTQKGDSSVHFMEVQQAADINDCDEGERVTLLLMSLDSHLCRAVTSGTGGRPGTWVAARTAVQEAMGLNLGSPFMRVAETRQQSGESPHAFADRLWIVYEEACGTPADRQNLGDRTAHWLKTLVANCLPAVRATAELWFDPQSPDLNEAEVLRRLTLAYRNGERSGEKPHKGKAHEVVPAPPRREWRYEGPRVPGKRPVCFGCGRPGHFKRDCRNPSQEERAPVGVEQAPGAGATAAGTVDLQKLLSFLQSPAAGSGQVAMATGQSQPAPVPRGSAL